MRHRRGSGGLLASVNDLSISALDIQASFERMSHTEQMRLYHATRAIAETQKIAFLQSSAESPGILMLLQELFYSSMDSLCPGETILELHKTSAAKGLTEAILKFFKYVVLFYHNCGNYDLITGVKILPEVGRYDLKEIISSSRAFTQHRGLRLQRLLDSCIDAMYSQGTEPISASSKTSSSKKEAELVEFKPVQCYPFYGAGVTFVDSVRVNRTLEAHGICKRNTRILKKRDVSGGSTVYTVVQPSVTAISEPIEVLPAHSSGKVRVYRGDFSHFLEKMIGSLQKSSDSEASKRVVESIAQVFADADETSLSSAFSTWKGTQDDVLDVFVNFFPVPKHRDPTGTRCAIESYVAVQNRVYQARLTQIIEHHVDDFVRFLPFHRLMRPYELLGQMIIQCVDLVATSRSRTVVPLNMSPRAADPVIPGPHKLLYIVNTTENYARGIWSQEKREQLDAFFLPNDVELIDATCDQVHFLRFILEEVLTPTTTVFLTGTSNNQPSFDEFTAAYLPAELYIETSDEEGIAIEDDSDPEWYNKPIVGLEEGSNEGDVDELWLHSSLARRPPQWYLPDKSYFTEFTEPIATLLEEARRMLASLFLVLYPEVRGAVCDDWTASDTTNPSNEALLEAYVLHVAHDGLLALSCFSTLYFRWEDDKMLARFMTLQMLLSDPKTLDIFSSDENIRTSACRLENTVVEVVEETESIERSLAQISLGVPASKLTTLRVRINKTPTSTTDTKGKARSWRHRLKIQVREWLQKLQWIQMTGDKDAARRWYEWFVFVSARYLEYRDFILLRLGDSDTKQAEAELAAEFKGITSPNQKKQENPKQPTPQVSSPQPELPTPSMEAQIQVSHTRNPSCIGHETIWIPPYLRITTLVDGQSNVVLASEQPHLQEPRAHTRPGRAKAPEETEHVELRVFPPELDYAIESFVLNIGCITEEEAAQFRLMAPT